MKKIDIIMLGGESRSLEHALSWLPSHDDEPSRVVLICTDSQGLCTVFIGNDLQPFGKILTTLANMQSIIGSGYRDMARYQKAMLQTRE